MTDIQYVAPKTLDEAVQAFAAAAGKGKILAGGTDLLVQMRNGMVENEVMPSSASFQSAGEAQEVVPAARAGRA